MQDLMSREPLLAEGKMRQLLHPLAQKLVAKISDNSSRLSFRLSKMLQKAHVMPLTNCAFNKSGDRFITGSYDQTCKVWKTETADEVATLEGHNGVVYALAFNNPFGDRVITGSFDKSAKIWEPETGNAPHSTKLRTALVTTWTLQASAMACCTNNRTHQNKIVRSQQTSTQNSVKRCLLHWPNGATCRPPMPHTRGPQPRDRVPGIQPSVQPRCNCLHGQHRNSVGRHHWG